MAVRPGVVGVLLEDAGPPRARARGGDRCRQPRFRGAPRPARRRGREALLAAGGEPSTVAGPVHHAGLTAHRSPTSDGLRRAVVHVFVAEGLPCAWRAALVVSARLGGAGGPRCIERVSVRVPTRRPGQPEAIAAVVSWLLEPDAVTIMDSVPRARGRLQPPAWAHGADQRLIRSAAEPSRSSRDVPEAKITVRPRPWQAGERDEPRPHGLSE